ncbi:galanin receptor type 2-like isoform X2 [Actinia tenebrosa]|nr:galanin receptor type 2-like isoform X2 [Actinia tenebrosa]
MYDDLTPSLSMKVGMTFAYAVTFIVGFVGNSVGMYVVCKRNGGVKTVTNLLIANMAFADLLVTLLSMPTSIAQMYISNRWFSGSFGTLTCKLIYTSFFLSLAASVFTIVFISAERYVAIFFPLRGDSLKLPKLLTCLIWVLAFLMTSPFLIIFTTKEQEPMGTHYCVTEWPWQGDDDSAQQATLRVLKDYFIAIFVILYCFPVLFVGFLYSLICFKLWFVAAPPNTGHKSHRAALQKSRKKVVKLLVAIVVVFTVCFFPSHLMHYYLVFRFDIYLKIEHWGYVTYWISQANSSINPCLYILLNDSFRHDFLKVLSRGMHGCCRRMSSCSRRRVKPRTRIRSNNSSSSHSQQRRLSFMQLLQVVRGTFSSAFNPTQSARITGETRLARNSLTPINHARVANDTKF